MAAAKTPCASFVVLFRAAVMCAAANPADVAAKIAPTPPPSFISRLFFLWGWPILRDGRKLGNALAPSDLPELPASSSPEKVAARLAACWAAELAVRPKKPSLPRAIYSFYGSATPKMLSGAAFMTALLCVQQVLPAMKAAGTGAILFTGASASLRGSAKFGSFAVNKCGLRALAQSLAREEAPGGVHVAHVVVDAMVDMPVIHDFIEKGFIEAAPGRLLDTGSAADVYWQLYEQDKRCMAFEVDLRPHEAQW